MHGPEIAKLRKRLNLTQVEFGQLLGAHFMTVSKWEQPNPTTVPTPYQQALIETFALAAQAKQAQAQKEVKNLLVCAGVVAALFWLFKAAKK